MIIEIPFYWADKYPDREGGRQSDQMFPGITV